MFTEDQANLLPRAAAWCASPLHRHARVSQGLRGRLAESCTSSRCGPSSYLNCRNIAIAARAPSLRPADSSSAVVLHQRDGVFGVSNTPCGPSFFSFSGPGKLWQAGIHTSSAKASPQHSSWPSDEEFSQAMTSRVWSLL